MVDPGKVLILGDRVEGRDLRKNSVGLRRCRAQAVAAESIQLVPREVVAAVCIELRELIDDAHDPTLHCPRAARALADR